ATRRSRQPAPLSARGALSPPRTSVAPFRSRTRTSRLLCGAPPASWLSNRSKRWAVESISKTTPKETGLIQVRARFILFCALSTTSVFAQNNSGKLAFLIPSLFGPDGLLLPNPQHQAHFDNDF